MTTTLSDYLEGVMRVPLSLLSSNGFSECPASFSDGASVHDFKRFLNNCSQPITGIVSPQKLDEILRKLEITRQEFQGSIKRQEPLSNSKFQINCLVGQHCLEKAKDLLGQNHACIVRIYSIPAEMPGRYSDGEICRQILLLHQKEPSMAQKWLEKLSRGKRKHVTMACHRQDIWTAMEEVAIFPGLWTDIKLGNWAKHLAAHLDDQIVMYWRHIFQVWNSEIFAGIDSSLRQHLDTPSARFLQFMAPAWSDQDEKAIRRRMNSGILFCNISDEEARSRLLRNILGFKGVIPSILTFHENMRYLTVGAKILEKYIEVKRPTEKAGPDLAPAKTPESLFNNLRQDWGKEITIQHRVECHEGGFYQMRNPLQAHLAFVQLLLVALRWFPFLSSEAPLQDIKGLGMPAYADDYYRRRLCSTARSLGFWNKMIEEGLGLPDLPTTREMPDFLQLHTESAWRGGLPTIKVFEELSTKSFLPRLMSACRENDQVEPNSTLIQYDLVKAFFGSFEVALEPICEPTSQPSSRAANTEIDIEMDWAQDEMAFETGQPTASQEPSMGVTSARIQKKRHGIMAKSRYARLEGDDTFTQVANHSFGKRRPKAKVKQRKLALAAAQEERGRTEGMSPDHGQHDMEPIVPEPHRHMSAPMLDGYDLPQIDPQSSISPEHNLRAQERHSPQDRGADTQRQEDGRVQSRQYMLVEQAQQVLGPIEERDADLTVPEAEHRISAPILEVDTGSPAHIPLRKVQETASQPEPHENYFPVHRDTAVTTVEINRKKKGLDASESRAAKRQKRTGKSDPAIPERNPAIPERNPAIPERNPVILEQNPAIPERNPAILERNPAIPERDLAIPERAEGRMVENGPDEEEL